MDELNKTKEKTEYMNSTVIEENNHLTKENESLKKKLAALMQENERLLSESEIDPLSKLYRRAAAVRKIEEILSENNTSSCALLVLDIDNFKDINDTKGHSYGDKIIAKAAGCIKSVIDSQSIPGRFGGDEFFVFMTNISQQEALETADDIIFEFKKLFEPGSQQGEFSFSCGVSYCTANMNFNRLFDMADKALYSAKRSGKGHAELYNHNNMKSIKTRAISYFDVNDININPHHEFVLNTVALALKSKTTDDAIYTIIKHMLLHFNINSMLVLNVDMNMDMIEVVYEVFQKKRTDERQRNKIGYYYHNDLTAFCDMLEDRKITYLSDEQISIFSKKFSKELRAHDGCKRYLFLNKISREKYGICSYDFDDFDRVLNKDEENALNEITSIIFSYSHKLHYETEREREMKEHLNFDKITHAYTKDNFFVQSGYIRKLALESGIHCYLLNIKTKNIREFNIKYSSTEGDNALKEFVKRFKDSPHNKTGIISHDSSTFYILVRTEDDMQSVKKTAMDISKDFILDFKRLYPDFTFEISIGIAEVLENEKLFDKMDIAYYDRTPVKI